MNRTSNILIVGGAGFVGSNLARMILNSTENVHINIVDNLLSSEKENIPVDNRITFIKGSITDGKILRVITDQFDTIFHLATFHGNQNSIFNPLADHENNCLTTVKLLEHVKHFKRIKRIVYSSAGCSVAKKTDSKAEATTEDRPIELNQDSPYSISKIIGEFYMVYYHKQHHLPTVRARFQNVYGPGEILGAGKWRGTYATVWRNVVPTFVYKALNCKPLPMEGNGDATRDFIFVDDICRGLLACATRGKPGEVYNLASGVETSIRALAEMINGMTDNTAGIERLTKRTWDRSGKRFASTEKSQIKLNFKARVNIHDGLHDTVEWAKIHMALIDKNIKKHRDHIVAIKTKMR